jgi:hypothetical protein
LKERDMNFVVQNLPAEDTWKDIVRVKEKYRKYSNGAHIHRGTICRIQLGTKSKWVIVHGRKTEEPIIQMDLNVRLALGVHLGEVHDFTFERLFWIQTLWFPWKASDPGYRIPAQLGLISFFLGTVLGILGALLGGIPLYEEIRGQIFKHQSNEYSVTPTPSSQIPGADKPDHH